MLGCVPSLQNLSSSFLGALSHAFLYQETSSNNSTGESNSENLPVRKKILLHLYITACDTESLLLFLPLIFASLELQQILTTQESEVTRPRPIIPHETCRQLVSADTPENCTENLTWGGGSHTGAGGIADLEHFEQMSPRAHTAWFLRWGWGCHGVPKNIYDTTIMWKKLLQKRLFQPSKPASL